MSSSSPAPRRVAATGPSTTAIFLVLRRMRAPLILLISLFAVSVFGLTLMPGVDPEGNPWNMDPFQAFYFMSYTATTIGFGEIPYPLSTQQRMWVIVSIYLSVVAWAYAIGSILALLQDKGFKEAMSLQRFDRRVRRLREPFLIIAGFGQAGEMVARSLDRTNHRIVVLDTDATRIEALNLAAFRSDVPGLQADASDPYELRRAGLMSSYCEGVIALTDDDQANLAVTMATELLRPGLLMVCRTVHDDLIERIEEFGSPMVVDPFNLYGDELMLAIRAPKTYQLISWLTSDPDSQLPKPLRVPLKGRWVVAGHGDFGQHLARDLHDHGIPVTVIDPQEGVPADYRVVHADASQPGVLREAGMDEAVAFAAATDNDTVNLALLVEAKQLHPGIFTIGRQNDPTNSPLFATLDVDSMMVPSKITAHEVLARVADPLMWRFVQQAQTRDDAWGGPLLERITALQGDELPQVWTFRIAESWTPAIWDRVCAGEVTLGALMHDPQDRDRRLEIVTLLAQQGDDAILSPGDDLVLRPDDRLLLTGLSYDRRALDTASSVPAAAEYVLTGDRVGSSWIWRTLVDR